MGLVKAGPDKVQLRPDKVHHSRTMSGEIGHCLVEALYFGI
jgi:hypothetical protein